MFYLVPRFPISDRMYLGRMLAVVIILVIANILQYVHQLSLLLILLSIIHVAIVSWALELFLSPP